MRRNPHPEMMREPRPEHSFDQIFFGQHVWTCVKDSKNKKQQLCVFTVELLWVCCLWKARNASLSPGWVLTTVDLWMKLSNVFPHERKLPMNMPCMQCISCIELKSTCFGPLSDNSLSESNCTCRVRKAYLLKTFPGLGWLQSSWVYLKSNSLRFIWNE